MTSPYYQDDQISLYHGDCLAIDAWTDADVLITDPPYGRSWKSGRGMRNSHGTGRGSRGSAGIAGDETTYVRDSAPAPDRARRPPRRHHYQEPGDRGMTANLRRVDYYTADQFACFSWWQRLRLRQRRAQAVTDAAHHPREGTTPMTHTHTATAGYIQTGDTITLPCGEEITVSRWESGPLPGEMSVYYDLPHGADRVILDSHQPIQFHGPATIGRVQRNGG